MHSYTLVFINLTSIVIFFCGISAHSICNFVSLKVSAMDAITVYLKIDIVIVWSSELLKDLGGQW